jgi:hypothetical protein
MATSTHNPDNRNMVAVSAPDNRNMVAARNMVAVGLIALHQSTRYSVANDSIVASNRNLRGQLEPCSAYVAFG